MTPREAFLGAQEVVPVEQAVGRIAAESLAAYPPGIPNVLPGERHHGGDLEYIQAILAARRQPAGRQRPHAADRPRGGRGRVTRPRYGPPDASQAPRYTGVRTFARCPHVDDPDGVDVAVVGIPFDTATSNRPGARFGPEAIRAGSIAAAPLPPGARRGRVRGAVGASTGATST